MEDTATNSELLALIGAVLAAPEVLALLGIWQAIGMKIEKGRAWWRNKSPVHSGRTV